MNREIKFRAWWSGGDEFVWFNKNDDCSKAWKYGEFETLLISEENNRIFEINDSEMIWQQYTGVKDKYGKEIYEGDIIKVKNTIQQVIFLNGSFGIQKSYGFKTIRGYQSVGIHIEVIGSIYENKELLKEKK